MRLRDFFIEQTKDVARNGYSRKYSLAQPLRTERGNFKLSYCWLVRGSLFIELGCTRDLGKGWRGDLGTFMISRSI